MNRDLGLEETHHIVADIPDRASHDMRHIGRRHEFETGESLLQPGQRIVFALPAAESDQWIESNEGKSAELFVALGRFKQKTGLPVVDFSKGRDRRFHVGDKIDNQRDEVAALRELPELIARGSYVRRHKKWRFAKDLPEPD